MKNFECKVFPYLMLTPTLLVFDVFLSYPTLNGIWIPLMKRDGVNLQKLISFQNCLKLAVNQKFWESSTHTILSTIWSVPLIYVSALGLAVPLTGEIKGSNFFRAIPYWLTMVSSIVVGLTWRFLLGEGFEAVNYLLTLMGCFLVERLTDAEHAIVIIIPVTIRDVVGYYMVMFVSGIEGVSQTYYEAARIDGGGTWQQFWYITLPLLEPTSLLVIILSTIDVIKTYPLVFTLTQGGPAGVAESMVQTVQETGLEKGQVGYASAVTMMLLLVLSFFTPVQFKMNRGGEQDME